MGKVGDSTEDWVSDRGGAATEAEGAVVWLATSKERWGAPFDALPAANTNHQVNRKQTNKQTT